MAPIPATQQQLIPASGAERRTKHRPNGSEDISRVPVHPISQLQGPFEESIIEAIEGTQSGWIVDLNVQSWRRDLLENPRYERLCGRKWRQWPGERQAVDKLHKAPLPCSSTGKLTNCRYHPFWKLVSQISFGIHLLVNRLAKSELEVLRILQGHVDELDGFLGRTNEDFLIIQIDIHTRAHYLSLPLQNLAVFDEMLQERNFRLTMIGYNEKIEHAIERFSTAVEDALKDIQKGREAIGALWQYLKRTAKDNGPLPGNLFAIYNAMLANTEGWNTALSKLRRKGAALLSVLSQLGLAVIEMQRRVGVASRKEVVSTRLLIWPSTNPPHSHVLFLIRSRHPSCKLGQERLEAGHLRNDFVKSGHPSCFLVLRAQKSLCLVPRFLQMSQIHHPGYLYLDKLSAAKSREKVSQISEHCMNPTTVKGIPLSQMESRLWLLLQMALTQRHLYRGSKGASAGVFQKPGLPIRGPRVRMSI
jgi:hypothetical protein